MNDRSKTQTASSVVANAQAAPLSGLFDEMQALMALMPGAGFDPKKPLSSDEETEAMFDNMPV